MTPDRLTPVCDIYALGCTLYYAVTARVPFPGGTVKEKARRHCHEQPVDPRRINPELDAAFIEGLLIRVLEKFPDTATPVTMTFRKAHFASGHDLKDFAEKLGIELRPGDVQQ